MSDTIDLVFSFDTTGSMYPCLTQVRRRVRETVQDLFAEIADIRIGIIAHGDYCDGRDCITSLDLTDRERSICKFVQDAPATGGGDSEECYELVLNTARGMTWRSRRSRALILIGDDIPHEVGYTYDRRRNDLDWRNEAELLAESGIKIYPVQALGRYHADRFYDDLARISGTVKLELPQFSDIVDLVLALCHHRADRLSEFEETLRERHRPASFHVMANIDRLAGRKVRSRPATSRVDTVFESRVWHSETRSKSGGKDTYMGYAALTDSGKRLVGVHPSRFQPIEVDDDCSINDFVRSNGLAFKKGRGFYEFTKRETIQAYKEVVLEDPETGRFFTGNKARVIAGLPIGKKGMFNPPEDSAYRIYVQSTSANRRLKAGTRFLYEIDDLVDTEAPTRPAVPASVPKKKCTRCAKRRTTTAAATTTAKGVRCGICGKHGHNRRTCPKKPSLVS